MEFHSQPANQENIKPTCEHVLRDSVEQVGALANRRFAMCRVASQAGVWFVSTRKSPHVANVGR